MNHHLSSGAAAAEPSALVTPVGPVPDLGPELRAAMEDFAAAVRQAQRETLAAGRPYSFATDGRVVWKHPDGTLRTGREPDSPLIGA